MRILPFNSLIILVCLIHGCTTTPEPDSSRFRGPSGSGHSSTTGLPLTWNASENIIWKKSLPGYGASSPITLDDKIFLTCYSGFGVKEKDSAKKSDLRLHVVCLNRDDGNLIWDAQDLLVDLARLADEDPDVQIGMSVPPIWTT